MMLDIKLEEYINEFGEGFPMYQLGRGRTEEETIGIIDRCLKEKKDVYELGLITDDDDVLY